LEIWDKYLLSFNRHAVEKQTNEFNSSKLLLRLSKNLKNDGWCQQSLMAKNPLVGRILKN
jgi:hypothetical protein